MTGKGKAAGPAPPPPPTDGAAALFDDSLKCAVCMDLCVRPITVQAEERGGGVAVAAVAVAASAPTPSLPPLPNP